MKISILIPTYNRLDNIKKQIRYFVDLLKDLACDYELVIGDNSTDDLTNVYISSLGNPQIIYFKNQTNIGYDENVLACFKHAHGDYLWLMGDKFYVLAEYINSILNTLSNNPDAVLLYSNKDNKGVQFNQVSEIVSEFGYRLSLLCSAIIKNDCLEILERCEKYKSRNFFHIGILIEYLCSKNNINVVWLPFYAFKIWNSPKSYWSQSVFKVFSKDWFYTIMSLPNSISVDAKIKCLKGENSKHHIFNPYEILLSRCKGNAKYSYIDLKENRQYLELTSSTTYNKIFLAVTIPYFFIIIPYYIVHSIYKLLK